MPCNKEVTPAQSQDEEAAEAKSTLCFLKSTGCPCLQMLDILVPVILSTQCPFCSAHPALHSHLAVFPNSCHTLSFSALILMFSPKIAPSQDLGIARGSHSVPVQWW